MKHYLKYSIGIDIGSKEFHVSIIGMDETQHISVRGSSKFANSEAGISAFWAWHHKHLKCEAPKIYVMEATGVYHENLCYFLYKKGTSVSVILPTQSRHYAKSLGNNTKTDKVDARVLAQMGAERQLTKWQPFSPVFYDLRQLTRQHEELHLMRTRISNRKHAHQSGRIQMQVIEGQIDKLLMLFEEQLQEIEKNIVKLVKEDEILAKKWKLIEPIYGIGMLTFATIAAETNGFELFRNERQLVSYAGYDVVQNQSGNHVGKTKISKKGNAHIRRILYMPALVAVKKEDSIFAKLYERIFQKTKIKMKGYVAVQRKLLCIIFHLWKKDVIFDPEFSKEHSETVNQNASLSVPNTDLNKIEQHCP